jgi:hypothetical protein
MLFLVGGLLGLLGGEAIVVRYLRHELVADISPRLRRLQLQLDNLEAAVNLALMTRYVELGRTPPIDPPQAGPSRGDGR